MRRIMSRNNRFLAAIGCLALVAVAVTGLVFVVTETERVDIERRSEQLSAAQRDLAELGEAAHDQLSGVDDYLLRVEADALERYQTGVAVERESATRLLSHAQAIPGLDESVPPLTAFMAEWRNEHAGPALEAARRGRAAVDAFLADSTEDDPALDQLLHPVVELIDEAETDLRGRTASLNATRTVGTALGVLVGVFAICVSLLLIRRYGRALERDAREAGVLNRFTEVTSFAGDDTTIAASNLEAIDLLVRPDAAVIHVFNRSKDRAVPEAVRGEAIADVLPLNALSRCSGMLRASMYVTPDLGTPLSVHCPIYPATEGTLACVPLSSGESVGAVHLYWREPNALPLELRSSLVRVAEHAALAIGNRRLLAALQGQANTDPRTGLANTRAFDQALEDALLARAGDESIAVLMLDLDHFKDFNDKHGHPAGDEALREFANVLRSCMRDSDLAARYGGEEFAVMLPSVDPTTALAIAERIRSRTESTIISLAPGLTDRVTVSVGVATAPAQALDRVTLLRIADDALYRAKQAGRNRVEYELREPTPRRRSKTPTPTQGPTQRPTPTARLRRAG